MGNKVIPSSTNLLFIDRDGVIIDEVLRSDGTFGSIRRIEDFNLLLGIIELFDFLSQENFTTVAVSNQPDICRNLVSCNFVRDVNRKLINILKLNLFLWCPHSDVDDCSCRKPKVGMFKSVLSQTQEFTNIFFIGDRDTDMEVCHNLNFIGIHLILGKRQNCMNNTHFHAKTLMEAKEFIAKKINFS